MKSLKLSIALILATSFSAACVGNKAATNNANQAAGKNAPAAPAASTNAAGNNANAASAPSATSEAASLYQSRGCIACHGADGKGNATMKDIPNFTDEAWQKKADTAQMINVIKSGKPPMPAYKNQLTDEQIEALVTYIRSLAK